MIGRFESRPPRTSMPFGAAGNHVFPLAFAGWTAVFPAGATWSIRRDLSGT